MKRCLYSLISSIITRHNEHDGVSNHQPNDCLLNPLFRRISKKASNLRVTGLCAGNSPVTGEFPAQRASNAEKASIWWRHYNTPQYNMIFLHDRPWISPWITSIFYKLDITIHVIAQQLSGHCYGLCNRLWRHQRNINRASETRGRCVKITVLSSFMDSFCGVRNKVTHMP